MKTAVSLKLRAMRCQILFLLYETVAPINRTRHDVDKYLQRRGVLFKLLRWEPTWRGGHLKLAETAEILGDLPLIYGSCRAVEQLSQAKDSSWTRARHLLARCYLKRAFYSQASEILNELIKLSGEKPEYLEDLGAIFFGEGKREQTRMTLEKIAPSRRSAEVQSMLNYLGLK